MQVTRGTVSITKIKCQFSTTSTVWIQLVLCMFQHCSITMQLLALTSTLANERKTELHLPHLLGFSVRNVNCISANTLQKGHSANVVFTNQCIKSKQQCGSMLYLPDSPSQSPVVTDLQKSHSNSGKIKFSRVGVL